MAPRRVFSLSHARARARAPPGDPAKDFFVTCRDPNALRLRGDRSYLAANEIDRNPPGALDFRRGSSAVGGVGLQRAGNRGASLTESR